MTPSPGDEFRVSPDEFDLPPMGEDPLNGNLQESSGPLSNQQILEELRMIKQNADRLEAILEAQTGPAQIPSQTGGTEETTDHWAGPTSIVQENIAPQPFPGAAPLPEPTAPDTSPQPPVEPAYATPLPPFPGEETSIPLPPEPPMASPGAPAPAPPGAPMTPPAFPEPPEASYQPGEPVVDVLPLPDPVAQSPPLPSPPVFPEPPVFPGQSIPEEYAPPPEPVQPGDGMEFPDSGQPPEAPEYVHPLESQEASPYPEMPEPGLDDMPASVPGYDAAPNYDPPNSNMAPSQEYAPPLSPQNDPYAQPAPEVDQGSYPPSPAEPGMSMPDPYGTEQEAYAPPVTDGYGEGSSGNPLDQFVAQDALVSIGQQGGGNRAVELQQEVALSRIREETKIRRGEEKRTKKNTRRKGGAPRFLRVTTKFRPGSPLVMAVTSPKGGVGKSTTAANLAAYMAKAAEISEMGDEVRVLLVDGDVANGNLALRVAQRLEPNMLDLLNHMDEVRGRGGELTNYEQDIGRFVLAHPKINNLDILAAPDNPDVISQIEQDDLEYLMATFARFYQIVVFDTGTQIVEHTNCAWLNFSSQVYLMVEPEIACLQVTAEYAKRARRLQLITPDVCRLVMIRADMDIEELDPRRVASEVFSFIPPDRAFFIPDFHRDAIETGNAGEFLTLDSAEYAESLTPIVRAALESYERQH